MVLIYRLNLTRFFFVCYVIRNISILSFFQITKFISTYTLDAENQEHGFNSCGKNSISDNLFHNNLNYLFKKIQSGKK